jgi:hypothetical protein
MEKQTLLLRLRRFAAEIGKTPTSTEMDRSGPHTARTYQKHFGSWNEALEAADLNLTRERNIPDDRLVESMTQLAAEIGESPSASQMEDLGEYSMSTYIRRFGSWNSALEAAELSHNQAPPGTSKYGMGWNPKKKEQVRKSAGAECEDCGERREEYRERVGFDLDVHHEVKPEKSTNPAVYNAPRNLIALCRSCHIERHA